MELHLFLSIEINKTLKVYAVTCFMQITDEDGKTTSTKATSGEMMDDKSVNSTETLSSEGKKLRNIFECVCAILDCYLFSGPYAHAF